MYRNTFCTTLSSVDKIISIQKFITVMTLWNYPVDYPCKPWLSCNQCQWTEAGVVTYNVCTTQAPIRSIPIPFRDQSEDKKMLSRYLRVHLLLPHKAVLWSALLNPF